MRSFTVHIIGDSRADPFVRVCKHAHSGANGLIPNYVTRVVVVVKALT